MNLIIFKPLLATAHFNYDGEEGPAYWADLDPENYASCNDKEGQSPINLPSNHINGVTNELSIHWVTLKSPIAIIHNGHTVQVNVQDNAAGAQNYVTFRGVKYNFLQFHFHGGSEHHVDGHQTPLEMHAVHQAEAGQDLEHGELLVVAFMLKENTDIKNFDNQFRKFENRVPVQKTAVPALIRDTFQFDEMIEDARIYGFWEYVGSLTTPPCSGGVQVY